MEGAEQELERRSRFLSGLIQKKKVHEQQDQLQRLNVRVRASDMPHSLQTRAFTCARHSLDSMPKLDSKRLALALKKEFDSSYGPAWHCIVGTSFGSYVFSNPGHSRVHKEVICATLDGEPIYVRDGNWSVLFRFMLRVYPDLISALLYPDKSL